MKEMTPVAGTTFSVQFFVWKISTSLLFDKALSWVLSKYQSVLSSPKINLKNVLGEMQFTEISLAIFLLYLAVFDM